MGELLGPAVIAVSALLLFALASIQLAHRIGSVPLDPLWRAVVLRELDDLPLSLVAGLAAAIAASSQAPVAYLLALHGDALSTLAGACLALELATAALLAAELAGARRRARSLFGRYGRRRSLAS
ncbi:MAG: hypothetical protein ACRDGT_02965 [Candidatus Limnocylindria bacterium]